MALFLAVDGGNSKTLAAVADGSGDLLSLVKDGGCNFQGIGRKATAGVLGRTIEAALAEAGAEKVDAACYGIAGADRDKDFEIIRKILAPIDPAEKSVLVNDTLLALRAGTDKGVGVALIGGAGSNCIGMDAQGRIEKAWGLGQLTGDRGNASALVLDAMVAAMKGVDGRGERTILEEKFKKALGLEALEDVIEFEYFDSPRAFDFASLASLVFEAAREGDGPAREVLRSHGRAAGEAALAVMKKLFSPDDEVPLVLGGSVLQKGESPELVEAVKQTVSAEFPRVQMKVLADHPLLGGVLRAMDLAGSPPGPEVVARARAGLEARLAGVDNGQ